jgi:RNA polymerase sigma-70 factor (ECF subfamily)
MKSWMLGSTPGATPSTTRDPEDDTARLQMQQRINVVMGALSSKLREALVLTEIEGLRPQEAAQVLGVPVNTVRSRRRLATEEFRRLWRDANKEYASHDD